MDRIEICKTLKDVTYLISVFKDDELVSQGSGVCINHRGDLVTAAHVISGSLPVQEKDVQELTIFAKAEGKKIRIYKHLICGLNMSSPYLKAPVTIDLAILRCVEELEKIPYIKIDPSGLNVGEVVLMCGYSDEVKAPFNVHANFDYGHQDFRGVESLFRDALEISFQFSMNKQGMVGRVYSAKFGDSALGVEITGSTFYVGNAMHSGASGGPIVNSSGNLVGIITQRAITGYSTSENPGLKVPSGSAIGITPGFIVQFFNNQTHKHGLTVEWHRSAAT